MQKYRLSIQGFVNIAVKLNFRFPILAHSLPIRNKAFNNPPLVNVCWKFIEIWPLDIILYDDRFPIRIQLMVPHLQKIALSDTAVCASIYELSASVGTTNYLVKVLHGTTVHWCWYYMGKGRSNLNDCSGRPPWIFNSDPMLKNQKVFFRCDNIS